MTKKTTAVATQGQLTQQDIPAMLEQVKQQIASMSIAKDGFEKTSDSLDGFGKIEDIKSVSDLIKAHSAVTNRAKAYKASASEIVPEGIKVPLFSIGKHSESQWVNHITSRVSEVANEKKLTRLRSFQKTLEENLSTEMKLANEMAKIAADLEAGL